MNRLRQPHQTISLLGAFACTLVTLLVAVACGSGKGATGVAQYYGNYHPAGWIDGTLGQKAHGSQAVLGVSACTKCHEISILKVGNGVPTCMTTGCHHQPGFNDASSHGIRAKLAVDDVTGGSLVSCQICHGNDFAGGASTKACSTCHGVSAPHPVKPWRGSAGSVFTHSTVDPSNAAVCAQCHYPGSSNNPAGHPSAPAPANTQPGCFNATLCHGANTAPHPVPFLATQVDSKGNGHLTVTAGAFAADCASCHAYSGASPTTTAPLCNVCHKLADPIAAGSAAGTCLSCHSGASGLPAGPGGTSFPNISGAHAKHMALPTALSCDSCHAGSGTGTVTHYTNANARVGTLTGPATVAMDVTFKAKTGNPAFTGASLTCSNVSCHGGQVTPAWQGGTLTTSTQCTACHAVAASSATAAQFNDAFGRHSLGTHDATKAANAIACATCHNMANGSAGALAHFKYLNTPAVDGVSTGAPADQMPSGTIAFDAAIVTGGTYTVTSGTQGNGSCALTCHSHVHTPTYDTWTASGAPHPVPFVGGQTDSQGNGHFTVTSAQFTADCGTCHAHSGTSPLATAPLCNSCHKLANPTSAGTNAGTCLSCHSGTAGLATGPGGTTFPSIAGAHVTHMLLTTPVSCDTCHAGTGTGTAAHYTNAKTATAGPAPVAMAATFNAKSGGATFVPASLTCSNVSCHGGQATPAWQGGTINANTQCTVCHAVATSATSATQFNDAFGRHSLGTHNATKAANNIACTTCHNMANGSPGALAHFKYLHTPAVDGVSTGTPADQMPSGTIAFNPAIVTASSPYDVTSAGTKQGDGGCALTCHTHVHTVAVNTWASPVPHNIPFLTGEVDLSGNGHLNATATTFAADCATCHAYSGTSPLAAAPLCNVCHQLANPTVLATGAGTCLSCHAGTSVAQNGPGGSSFPSIAGAHAKHMALPTVLSCDSCHAGSGTGTTTHYDNANARTGTPAGPAAVSINISFQAQTGGAVAFTGASLTCSNVSCHGGQTTPGWQVGTLNANTQCTACHGVAASAGTTTQFNDAFGRHSLGTHDATNGANSIACTTCHNMANGSSGALAHFKYLNTAAVDGVATGTPADQMPSGTIVFDAAIVTVTSPYNVTSAGMAQGNGGCALTCHTHIHVASFDTWTSSGAPHPVPFLTAQTDTQGNGHLTVTAAQFTADCGTCHAYSGTSPISGAPLCATCHTLANPTLVATGTGTCLSCHVGNPGLGTGPTGSSFPSIMGSHAKHMGLPTTLTCDTCHAGAGTGSLTHYTNANARVTAPTGPATVSIDATYNAQSGGTAGFTPSALTCSSVSCHGGKATPNWQTGTITSTSQCTVCHAINGGTGTSQYNDAVGRHGWGTHSTAGTLDCTLCHDMTQATLGVQNHFAELNTTPVSSTNKLPSTTIKFNLSNATYPITGAATYTINGTYPEGDGGCALTCHSQVHTPVNNHWAMPKGSGVAHPVPFYSTDLSTGGNHHQTLTLAQFNGECSTCHDISGSSSKSGPTCNVCHTLADPTAVATGTGTCLSCHIGSNFKTLGPQGASNQAWPNLPGAHAKHMNLLTFTRTSPALPATLTASVCEACHVGSVPGDSANTHYSNANKRVASPKLSGPGSVSIVPTFNAQSGTASITASATQFTCSNVSCHGGQVTPGWQTNTIPVNGTTYCIACHKVTGTATQYNDATGRHNSPSNHRVVCSYCHDMTQSTPGALNHFKYLDTTVVSGVSGSPSDQFPSTTIKFDTTNVFPNGSGPSYTASPAQGQGYCTLTCHAGGEQHDSGRHWN